MRKIGAGKRFVRYLVYNYCRRSPVRLGKTKLISAARHIVTPCLAEASLLGGAKILADLSDLVPRLIYFLGYYEYGLTNLIQETLQAGDTFLDVGSHVGYYTVMSGNIVGPRGSVHSFEPVPEIFSQLLNNVALNSLKNVHTNQYAVWDQDGELEIFLPKPGNTGTGSFVRQPNSSNTSIRCPALTIDSYIQKKSIKRVRLIKLDVEGAELKALHGMKRLLTSADRPDVISEIVPSLLGRGGTSYKEMILFMENLGFRARIITDNGLVDLEKDASPHPKVGWNLHFSTNPN